MANTEIGHDRLFEVIAEEATSGIMVFHSDDQSCVYINRKASESLEVKMTSDIYEQPDFKLADLFPTETHSRFRLLTPELVSAQGYYANVLIRKIDGMVIVANISVKHVHLENSSMRYLVMFEDITIQKKLQREVDSKQDEIKNAFNEILEQNKQLKELDNAKDRFIALTTHELRTPLSAIVATAEVLELKLYESDQQRDDFIKTIHEQGLQLMELVNDILDFAKIQAGKMEFYVEQSDIVPQVSKLIAGYEQMAAQSQIMIATELPATPVTCFADWLRLKEVITNVVSNAIKYNKQGGKVDVRFSLLDGGKFARISVTDTGPGIAASKLHHVFNEFETVGHVSRHHKGTGLGMPISKRLMQAIGGDLTLTSVEGEGSTFFIDIPTEKVLSEESYRVRTDTWGDLAA
jgi:signal transduction histidine kinase